MRRGFNHGPTEERGTQLGIVKDRRERRNERVADIAEKDL